MRTLLVCLVLLFVGCGSINPQIQKFDKQNYEANKKLAVEQMQTWSFSSGVLLGMGLTNKVAFPIKSGEELRAILTSPAIVLAITDLDTVCKRLGYWKEEDYDLGFSLGAKIRAGSQVAIQFVKDFFPDIMKYAPALFGL